MRVVWRNLSAEGCR